MGASIQGAILSGLTYTKNWLLGDFIIENLPKKRAGEAKIKVQFNIDYNSSLEVQLLI